MNRRLIVAAMSSVLLVPFAANAQEALSESMLQESSYSASASSAFSWDLSFLTAAPDGYHCPQEIFTFSPLELWDFRYAAISAGDLDRTMCTYARNAVVITPGNVAHGRDEIRQALSMMFMFLPNPPVMTSVTNDGPVVMVTFHAEGPMISIPDGSDTYVIVGGLIRYQTVHDSMVPTAQ